MKVVKFILWPTLLFCLVWISIIFFGPPIITSAVFYFSKGNVELTGVKVSPKLKFSAAAIDFSLPLVAVEKGLSGVSRAVLIDWKVRGGLQLVVSAGPSSFREYGTLKSTKFTLKPISIFDWSEVKLKLEFDQIVGADFELVQGELKSKLTSSFQELENVELSLSKVHGEALNTSFKVAELSLSLDKLKISQPFYQQDLHITYSIRQLMLPKSTFEITSTDGDIRLADGEVALKISASEVQFVRQQLKAKNLTLSSKRLLLSKAFEGTWDLSISEIKSKFPAFDIEAYKGYVTANTSGISHGGRAVISKAELKMDKFFIGQIENGVFDVLLTSRGLPSSIKLEGQGLLTLRDVDNFSLTASSKTSLEGTDILSCIYQQCGSGIVNTSYKINVSGASLTGNFKCGEALCSDRGVQHKIQTDNTNKFFQALSKLDFLNPLILPLAYISISNGEVIGQGHALNF